MTMDADTQLRSLRLAAVRAGLDVPELALPDDRVVVVDGRRLHYLDWSAPAGARDVVLLHGGALTAHTWDLTCLALRKGFHCIALDQRGHGDSDWAPDLDYSTDAHVGDLERFALELGLNDFVLVGMSLGGINSIAFAARHSEQINGLVIVDVGHRVRRDGASRIRRFIEADAELDSVDLFVDRAVSFNPRRDPDVLRTTLMHNLRRTPNGTWAWKYDQRQFREAAREAPEQRRRRLEEFLPRIDAPTLVVRGAESDVFLAEDAEEVVALLPNGRFVTVADAGHSVHADNPRDFVSALHAFFDEIGLTAG
jgi:pimeloyl-ACP methyl ester carboxylesterase